VPYKDSDLVATTTGKNICSLVAAIHKSSGAKLPGRGETKEPAAKRVANPVAQASACEV